jgi:hypothetical protein
MAQLNQEVFGASELAELSELAHHENVGIALRAQWEKVRRSMPERNRTKALPVNPRDLREFLRFADTRLGFDRPAWWDKAVLSAQAYGRHNIFFSSTGHPPYESTPTGLLAPRSLAVRSAKDALIIGDAHTQSISQKVLKLSRRKGPTDAVSAIIEIDRAFVALHAMRTLPFKIHCVAGSTIKWSADVWASGGSGLYSGVGFHYVQLLRGDGTLYVFGGGDDAVYIEAFRERDGNNVFRFSSSY